MLKFQPRDFNEKFFEFYDENGKFYRYSSSINGDREIPHKTVRAEVIYNLETFEKDSNG